MLRRLVRVLFDRLLYDERRAMLDSATVALVMSRKKPTPRG